MRQGVRHVALPRRFILAPLDRTVTRTLVTVIFGAVRNAFERNLPAPAADALRGQLLRMCRSYLHHAG